ncbi:hypothetical protein [Clostridium sp. BL-8]|uniref:hypothetical protein n=1 Tax=Clostridium sp. BL-8 TaxID=349938 RepID=UPI00098C68C3|nr:hypothetical protein [Clostridium sp. BL-8]OOM77825.1 hypothetical protein CLOBL_27880 [Clostridium sp. BL-8]
MSSVYPWIYVDYRDNIWSFFQNDNKELNYSIMYGEGKWTKDTLIDKDVLEFAVHVEEDETIHIVYTNINGELKYCTMQDKQWVGKTLYEIEKYEVEIQNLKIKIIGADMHIFYLLVSNDGSDHGVLMHCTWNGKEIKNNTLYDIILTHSIRDHYTININEDMNLEIFFVTDEGDESSLNYSSYENNTWSEAKRLYGIQGEDIGFEVLVDKQNIHVLNKFREDSIYFFDHVRIDINGEIQEFRVYESSKELHEPILLIKSSKLYCCWLEEDKIFCASFEDEKWSSPFLVNRESELPVKQYNCFTYSAEYKSIRAMKVYGTDEPDFYLYIPSQLIANTSGVLKYERNRKNEDIGNEALQKLKLELSRVRLEKKSLENKIESLNIQLRKKQRSMEEYEERFARVLEQKRKADENYKVFLELQQNIKKELESTSNQLIEEKKSKANIENELKKCTEENILIKREVEKMSEENKRLFKELEFERNQTIMERLLKKKPN